MTVSNLHGNQDCHLRLWQCRRLFDRRRAASQIAALSEFEADFVLSFLQDKDLETAFESGHIDSATMLDHLRTNFLLDADDEKIQTAYADMFTENPEVCELIPRLKPTYRLLLLSNTNAIHYWHFRKQFAAVLDCFDHLVLSHLVGMRKPHPKIYEHVVEQADCPAGQCLFIDDLPENIQAAQDAGLQGLVYQPGQDLKGQLKRMGINLLPSAQRTRS